MRSLYLNPFIQLRLPLQFRAFRDSCSSSHSYICKCNRRIRKFGSISARLNNSEETKQQQQQLNLSVLRFTLGIPGFDESILPRWIGYGFGSLLLLNHFVGSNSTITPAQLSSEALGLSLAAFSIALPYLGKFLKGMTPMDQSTLPDGNVQIFVMSENLSDTQKEDLAWGTYILLRNTNTISVLISIQDALCVRGYWNTPEDVSKASIIDWFKRQIDQLGLSDLKDTLYFPQSPDSGLWVMLPKGTRSLLVQPVLRAPNSSANETKEIEGLVMLASSMSYAYSNKDRAWIAAVANKFRGENTCTYF
ncbi:hypothetical protein HHK36_028860 [Tetracentron sinense]|uniref:Protein COFACTOR ASSEMBLY OF COMPLEX C SUBUNIT B CCB2, chloroplastic n=1 Tax=Tetracentron sinense TaxID=13715 RepID=A0A834YI58_TETSI|nr:hypothetical protein HHK36_028860 [Tetracentron sinense]